MGEHRVLCRRIAVSTEAAGIGGLKFTMSGGASAVTPAGAQNV
jgi:hypothetical protein